MACSVQLPGLEALDLVTFASFQNQKSLGAAADSWNSEWLWDRCSSNRLKWAGCHSSWEKRHCWDSPRFLNSSEQRSFDSHRLLFHVPNQLLLPSCRCSDTQLAQGRKQVAKKSTSFRPGSVGSGHSSPSSPVLGDTPAAGRALPAPQHR